MHDFRPMKNCILVCSAVILHDCAVPNQLCSWQLYSGTAVKILKFKVWFAVVMLVDLCSYLDCSF